MRLQRAGLMASDRGRLRLLAASPELVATTAVGPLVALGGRTAAQWYGWPLLEPPDQIELAVPKRRCPTRWPGARIVRQQLTGDDVRNERSVPTTNPLRTAVDLAVQLPVIQAVAVLDGACRDSVPVALLQTHLRRLGRPKLLQIADLVDPARASVYESVFFLLVVFSGTADADLPVRGPIHRPVRRTRRLRLAQGQTDCRGRRVRPSQRPGRVPTRSRSPERARQRWVEGASVHAGRSHPTAEPGRQRGAAGAPAPLEDQRFTEVGLAPDLGAKPTCVQR